MAKPAFGYHFCATLDGTLAIEADQPYPGAVTLTWKPSAEFPGSAVEVVMPQEVFQSAGLSYFKEVASTPKTKVDAAVPAAASA